MILLDTDVAVDILRGHPPAVAWLQGLGSAPLGLPGLVVMELIQGCQNKADQQRVEQFCHPYALYWPTQADCQRDLQDFATFRRIDDRAAVLRPTSPNFPLSRMVL
jgi:predicted nucleic acid-binding protein